jgi:hypothetical protein
MHNTSTMQVCLKKVSCHKPHTYFQINRSSVAISMMQPTRHNEKKHVVIDVLFGGRRPKQI